MQNVSIPTLYAIRYYCMKMQPGTREIFVSHLDWERGRGPLADFSKLKTLQQSPLWPSLNFSVSFCSSDVTDALFFFLAHRSRYFCLSLCFGGPKAVFGFGAAAYTWCSEAEVIMWVTSLLRLEGAQEWQQVNSPSVCVCSGICYSARCVTKQKVSE